MPDEGKLVGALTGTGGVHDLVSGTFCLLVRNKFRTRVGYDNHTANFITKYSKLQDQVAIPIGE